MDYSHDVSSLNTRFRDWRRRHTDLMERLSDALEKLSIWISTVKEKSETPTGSSQTPSEQIDALSERIKSLEAITEDVPKVQGVVFATLGSMRKMSDKLIDAREKGTLTADMLDEGDEELSTAERTIAALEKGLVSLPDL